MGSNPPWPWTPLLPLHTRTLDRHRSDASSAVVSCAPTLLDTEAPTEHDTDASGHEDALAESVTPMTLVTFRAEPHSRLPDAAAMASAIPRSRSRSRSRGAVRVVSSGRSCLLPLSSDSAEPLGSSHTFAGPVVPPGAQGLPDALRGGGPTDPFSPSVPPVRIRSPGRLLLPPPVEIIDIPETPDPVATSPVPGITRGAAQAADFSNALEEEDESEFRMNGSYSEGSFGADLRDLEPKPEGSRVPALLLVVPEAEVVAFPSPCARGDSPMGLAMGLGAAMRDALTRGHNIDAIALRVLDDTRGVEDGWRHASARIAHLARGGVTFYIGITEDPCRRWQEHAEKEPWSYMEVLVEAPTSRATGELEERLIEHFGRAFGCRNVGKGNERRSGGRPHYLYVVVGDSGLLRRSR